MGNPKINSVAINGVEVQVGTKIVIDDWVACEWVVSKIENSRRIYILNEYHGGRLFKKSKRGNWNFMRGFLVPHIVKVIKEKVA